jgi:hypothetical protein
MQPRPDSFDDPEENVTPHIVGVCPVTGSNLFVSHLASRYWGHAVMQMMCRNAAARTETAQAPTGVRSSPARRGGVRGPVRIAFIHDGKTEGLSAGWRKLNAQQA